MPDFTTMYELYDPCTCMFFFRNKHIMIDLGEGGYVSSNPSNLNSPATICTSCSHTST